MKAGDFTTYACQAIAFTPDGGPPVARVADLIGRWAKPFDGAPVVLPQADLLPLPGDVPRVQLTSADSTWRFDIAPARATLVHSRGTADERSFASEFFADAATRFVEYSTRFDVRIGRVAALVTRAAEQADPGRVLALHFCAERWHNAPLNRPEAFELHAHKKYDPVGGPRVNSWMRIRTGTIQREGQSEPIVLAEQDINTLAEDQATANLRAPELELFYSMVVRELDHVLALYFPEEG